VRATHRSVVFVCWALVARHELRDGRFNLCEVVEQVGARTLQHWRREVLAYFRNRLTNGVTEGFNLKAKLVKRRAYAYRSFRNYRLRFLNACA
jgi:transposase